MRKMLSEIKKEYEGQEIKLLDLDNEMLSVLNLPEHYGMFEKDVMETLYYGNFVYVTDPERNEGIQVHFEIVKNDETYPTNIEVKVTLVENW